jgi:phosphoribosylaminoimidazole synthetase
MIKPKIIYIHQEKSGRSTALVKHITKYNPEYTILPFIVPENLNSYLGSPLTPKFLFLLNENAITQYGEQYEKIVNKDTLINLIYPTFEQAKLENSKIYCRQFLESINLGYLNPSYCILSKLSQIDKISFKRKVIKADGLASGKGVFVSGDHYNTDIEGYRLVTMLLDKHEHILLEEKLEGEEFSCISLCWNGLITHFPLVKDFKRLLDGDQGNNTGGMATITFPGGSMPFLTDTELAQCLAINETVMIETGFRGFLYASFIKTVAAELKIIEYNVRLGDSEAINILGLLESSLIDYLNDPVKNPLIINNADYTFFRYLVPRDYSRDSMDTIEGCTKKKNAYYLVDANLPANLFYIADSKPVLDVNNLYTIGKSRTCGILTRGTSALEVERDQEKWIKMIYGDFHYRTDITFSKYYKSPSILSQMNINSLATVNYLGHLNNYNHIITNTKQIIDEHNLAVALKTGGDMIVSGRIGDFANSIEYKGAKLICSVDGAGTKTKFLEGHPERFRILGIDIVNHNINDMYCNNGHPIALLDYYGCDKLNKTDFNQFIDGALSVCKEYGIALIGGETAEMRGIFIKGEIEVLGILLGVIKDGQTCTNGDCIQVGNIIYGLESTGAHTNGFTKLREIDSQVREIDGIGMPENIREFFSQPHKSYVPVIEYLQTLITNSNTSILNITGKAHITGGGFQDNISRILPDSLMQIELESWVMELTNEWQWLYNHAGMKWDEFIRVFNAGWGFCVIVNGEIPDIILRLLENHGFGKIKKLGKITYSVAT